jgi:hypothetical protein
MFCIMTPGPIRFYEKLRAIPAYVSVFVVGGPGPDILGPPMAVMDGTPIGTRLRWAKNRKLTFSG